IRQLEREGLLYSQPYKETVVSDIHMEEVRDVLIPVRFHLEWFVISKYIAAMDAHFFEYLQHLIDEMKVELVQENWYKLVELDVAFHEHIIRLADEKT